MSNRRGTILEEFPNLVTYLENKDDAYLTCKSGKKVNLKCPICGSIRVMSVSSLTTCGYSCNTCGDKVSYPNKFMYVLLSMLNIDFKREVTFEWSNRRVYDFLVGKTLIEMDGGFHLGSKYRSYEECKEIDDLKDAMALENGYDIIRIDCRHSKFDFIKNNVINSKLNDILDLSIMDWDKLDVMLSDFSMVKLCSETFENGKGKILMCDMAESLGMSYGAFQNFLKIGAKAGLTEYNVEDGKAHKYLPEDFYKKEEIEEDYTYYVIPEPKPEKPKKRESWNKGIPMRDESKKKLSESTKGRTPWNKGFKMPQEWKDTHKAQGSVNWATGIPNPRSKKTICEGVVYNSVHDCWLVYQEEIKYHTLKGYLNGRIKNIPQIWIDRGLGVYEGN